MNVFIAGATGVIGRNLIPLLRDHGHTARGLSTDEKGSALLRSLGAEPHVGDLLAPDAESRMRALVGGCDAIIHVATALGKHPEAPSAEALQRTARLRTQGAQALLRAARECGVRQYVQESLELAYPDRAEQWIDESVALDTSPQRAAICGPVIEMEEIVAKAASPHLRCIVLRAGRLIGPQTGQENAIAALRSRSLRVAGDGQNYISLVHVKDYVRAVVLALEARSVPPVLNINAEPLREGDYYDALADSIGAPRPERDATTEKHASHRCSTRAAKAALGWAALE